MVGLQLLQDRNIVYCACLAAMASEQQYCSLQVSSAACLKLGSSLRGEILTYAQ